jgi:hypothetical protein
MKKFFGLSFKGRFVAVSDMELTHYNKKRIECKEKILLLLAEGKDFILKCVDKTKKSSCSKIRVPIIGLAKLVLVFRGPGRYHCDRFVTEITQKEWKRQK